MLAPIKNAVVYTEVFSGNLNSFKRSTDIRRLSRLSMLHLRQTRMSTLRTKGELN